MAFPLSARRARLLAVRDLLDAAGGGAMLAFSGPQPSVGGPPGTPPHFIVALGAVSFELHATDASMSTVVVGHVAISGTPTWARFVDGSGNVVMDLPAGPPGTAAPVIISDGQDPPTAQLWTGGEVTVTITCTESA